MFIEAVAGVWLAFWFAIFALSFRYSGGMGVITTSTRAAMRASTLVVLLISGRVFGIW